MSHEIKKIIWITAFSAAMGYLESAVVVYLRAIYYPEGFNFPLTPIDAHIAITEIFREAATIVMLLGVGFIGEKWSNKAGVFCLQLCDLGYILLRVPEMAIGLAGFVADVGYFIFNSRDVGWAGNYAGYLVDHNDLVEWKHRLFLRET